MGIYEDIAADLPHNIENVEWKDGSRINVNVGSGVVETEKKVIESIVAGDDRGDTNKQTFIVKDSVATIKKGHSFIRNGMTYKVQNMTTEWLEDEKLHICYTEHQR